jgi:hypothetical protein
LYEDSRGIRKYDIGRLTTVSLARKTHSKRIAVNVNAPMVIVRIG